MRSVPALLFRLITGYVLFCVLMLTSAIIGLTVSGVLLPDSLPTIVYVLVATLPGLVVWIAFLRWRRRRVSEAHRLQA